MDFEPCFKVHNLVSVQPKRIKLGQTINLNVVFHVMVSITTNLKLAPVPCATSERPIITNFYHQFSNRQLCQRLGSSNHCKWFFSFTSLSSLYCPNYFYLLFFHCFALKNSSLRTSSLLGSRARLYFARDSNRKLACRQGEQFSVLEFPVACDCWP